MEWEVEGVRLEGITVALNRFRNHQVLALSCSVLFRDVFVLMGWKLGADICQVLMYHLKNGSF